MSSLLTLYFMALYHSEGWYSHWVMTRSLHSKARAIVLFDRVLLTEGTKLPYSEE